MSRTWRRGRACTAATRCGTAAREAGTGWAGSNDPSWSPFRHSLAQTAPGQLQEDVLEGGPAHVHLVVLEALALDRGEDLRQEGLGIRGQNLPDVSARLDGRAEPSGEGGGVGRGAVEGELDDAWNP